MVSGWRLSSIGQDFCLSFVPAVSAMMALMDGSPMTPADPPRTPEHHRAEEDHPEEEEAQHPAICCICHDVLIQSGMEVEALTCGHVFHSECLAQCRDVGGFVGTWPLKGDLRSPWLLATYKSWDDPPNTIYKWKNGVINPMDGRGFD